VAVVGSVSTEALADTSVIVADTSSRALLQGVGSRGLLGSINGRSSGSSDTSTRIDDQKVQVTSVVAECDITGQISSSSPGASNCDILDNTVGDTLKGSLDSSVVVSSGSLELFDCDGGPSLTIVVNVGKGEGTGSTISGSSGADGDSLDLVDLSVIERVSVLGAKSLLARVTGVTEVANTSLVVKTIPKVVGVAGSGGSSLGKNSIGGSQSVGKIHNVSAHSVTAAVIGAHCSLASTSLISLEADALTSGTITETLVGALHVGVGLTGNESSSVLLEGIVVPLGVDGGHIDLTIVVQVSLGRVNKGLTVLASALGAVVTSPVAVAGTHIVGTAGSMARAHVVALSGNGG